MTEKNSLQSKVMEPILKLQAPAPYVPVFWLRNNLVQKIIKNIVLFV